MANTSLTASIVAETALAVLENELGVVKTMYRAHESEFDKTHNGYKPGATINIRRPEDGTVRTGATASITDVLEGQVTLTVDQQIGTDFTFTSQEMTLEMPIEDLTERVIKPRMSKIVNHMTNDILTQMYQGAYNYAGTPATTFSGFASFARGAERLDMMAAPMDNRCAVLSTTDKWGFIGPAVSLNVQGIANPAYREGDLGRVAGVDTHMSQVVPTHTTGTRASGTLNAGTLSVSYDTAKNTWSQTLAVTSVTGIANAGDVFTLAGVNMVNPKTGADTGIPQQFVVLTTSASGPTTLSVSPPIITSGPHRTVTAAPATNAVITWLGAASTDFRQNMFYHKNAMALAVVKLEIPPGSVGAATSSYKGFSCRVIPYYDGTNDKSNWRLDILYGRRLIDPRLVARVGG